MRTPHGWYISNKTNPPSLVWIDRATASRECDSYVGAEFQLDVSRNAVMRFETELHRINLRPTRRAHFEGLLAQSRREVAQLERLLNPLLSPSPAAPVWPVVWPAPVPAQVAGDVTEDQDVAIADVLPEEQQAHDDAAHLGSLGIPRELGRPAVREWLRENAPEFKISDQRLAAAVAYRRREVAVR